MGLHTLPQLKKIWPPQLPPKKKTTRILPNFSTFLPHSSTHRHISHAHTQKYTNTYTKIHKTHTHTNTNTEISWINIGKPIKYKSSYLFPVHFSHILCLLNSTTQLLDHHCVWRSDWYYYLTSVGRSHHLGSCVHMQRSLKKVLETQIHNHNIEDRKCWKLKIRAPYERILSNTFLFFISYTIVDCYSSQFFQRFLLTTFRVFPCPFH